MGLLHAITLAIALAPAAEAGAPPASDEGLEPGSLEELHYRGAAQFSAADYPAAIESFTAALVKADGQDADPVIRAAILFNLARSHALAHEVDPQLEHLRKALHVYERYLEEVETHALDVGDRAEMAEEDSTRIRVQLAELERQAAAEPEAQAQAPTTTEPPPPGVDRKRRTRGIALSVTGGVLLAGGAGMIGWGATFRGVAERSVQDENGGMPPNADEQNYIDQQARSGLRWVGIGAGVAAVGAGLLAWGIVDIVKAKPDKQVAVAPSFGPEQATLVINGRF